MNRQDNDDQRWTGRPRAALAIKAVVLLAPIAMSIMATHMVSRVVPRPSSLVPIVLWWVSLSVFATAVLYVADRAARKMLPLAALLQLSLVFPDHAPSRFKTAMRTQTVHQLTQRIADIRAHGLPDDPALAAETLIELVADLSAHDRLTRGHAERVRAYSRMIGEELELPSYELDRLQWAGLAHDVGKLFVPSEILNKPGRLTDDEFNVIKQHPGWGAEMCRPLEPWLGEWVGAVGEHHERWDGGGYPAGLSGEEISLAARIVSVADVYDVITSARSYKSAASAVDGRQELARCAGTQFDPRIVRAFLNISLGRLRLVMGPLSWLAQLPVVGRLPVGPAAGVTVSAAATVATLVAGGLVSHSASESSVVEAAPIVAEVVAAPPSNDPGIVVAVPPTTATPTIPTATIAPTRTVPVTTESATTTSTNTTLVVPLPIMQPVIAAPAARTPSPTKTSPPSVTPAVTTTTLPITTTPPSVTPAVTTTTVPITTTPPSVTPAVTTTTVPITTTPPSVTTTVPITTTPPPTTTVPPAPLGPAAVDDAVSTAEDMAIEIDVATNDARALAASLDSLPANGTLTRTDATRFLFEPTPDWSGDTSFHYTVLDANGSASSATVVISVSAIPDAPVARNDEATVDEDGTVDLSVLANDTDADADLLTVVSVSADDGVVTTDGTTVTFSPPSNESGTMLVRYTISDGTGQTAAAIVTVAVDPLPDAPSAGADAYSTQESSMLVVPEPGVLANDGDEDGDVLTVAVETEPVAGTLTLASDGSFAYTPAPAFVGPVTFQYRVSDGTGRSDVGTVTIEIGSSGTEQRFYLGTSGTSATDWALTVDPPPAASPEPDHDGDGRPGLTIDPSSQNLTDTDPRKFQHWSTTPASNLRLAGPVRLVLWSTVEDFEDEEDIDYSVWLQDCAANGTGCVTLASSLDVHIDEWNRDQSTWIQREITIGSVDATISTGRMLRLRLMFNHDKVWIALSGARASTLEYTRAD